MASSQLCLSWKDHSHALSTVCKTLLEDNFLVDCTIAADGQSIKAHRLILSACSPYFQMLFGEESEKHPIVILKDVSFDTLKAVMDFVYHGESKISEEDLEAFLSLAASLQIKGLNDASKRNRIPNSFDVASSVGHCSANESKNIYEVQSTSASHEENNDNFVLQHQNYPPDGYPNVAFSNSISFEKHSDTFEMEANPPVVMSPHEQNSILPDDSFVDTEQSAELESIQDVLLVPKQEQLDDVENDEVEQEIFDVDSDTMDEEMLPDFEEQNLNEYSSIAASSSESASVSLGAFTIPQATVPPDVQGEAASSLESASVLLGAFTIPPTTVPPNVEGAEVAEAARRTALLGRPNLMQGELQCRHCLETFAAPSLLENHMRIHTGGRPFKCDVCSVSFAHRGSLKAHMRKHMTKPPFRCDVCGYAFPYSSALRTHMRKHTGERPFSCDVCGESFSQGGNLRKHIRTHTGERPYSCDVCGDSFSDSGTLKLHKRRHTGERPYSCDVCGDSFSRASHLNMHKRRHTGERPYACDVCGYTFSVPNSLKKHKRRHKGEVSVPT